MRLLHSNGTEGLTAGCSAPVLKGADWRIYWHCKWINRPSLKEGLLLLCFLCPPQQMWNLAPRKLLLQPHMQHRLLHGWVSTHPARRSLRTHNLRPVFSAVTLWVKTPPLTHTGKNPCMNGAFIWPKRERGHQLLCSVPKTLIWWGFSPRVQPPPHPTTLPPSVYFIKLGELTLQEFTTVNFGPLRIFNWRRTACGCDTRRWRQRGGEAASCKYADNASRYKTFSCQWRSSAVCMKIY